MSPRSAPATPTPRGRREHLKQVTRRELLETGRRLFAERGLYESRIEDLTQHAGIAKGTLYGYFHNKEELIEAVVTSGFSELLGSVHHAVQGARSHEEVLTRLVEAHLEFFERNPDLMRIFHQVRGLLMFRRPGAERLRGILANYIGALSQLLTLHDPSPHGSPDQLREAATLMFGAISGLVSARASLAGGLRDETHSRPTIRALVAMTRAAAAPGWRADAFRRRLRRAAPQKR